jgi:hypothetical protein
LIFPQRRKSRLAARFLPGPVPALETATFSGQTILTIDDEMDESFAHAFPISRPTLIDLIAQFF